MTRKTAFPDGFFDLVYMIKVFGEIKNKTKAKKTRHGAAPDPRTTAFKPKAISKTPKINFIALADTWTKAHPVKFCSP